MIDQRSRWVAVGEAITARMAEIPMSQAELSRASGVSDVTVRALMRGTPRGTPRPPIPARICKALGWTPDSIDRLLAGQEPDRLEVAPEAPSLYVTREEFIRLRGELRDQMTAAIAELHQAVEDLTTAAEHRIRVDQERPPIRQPPQHEQRQPS